MYWSSGWNEEQDHRDSSSFCCTGFVMNCSYQAEVEAASRSWCLRKTLVCHSSRMEAYRYADHEKNLDDLLLARIRLDGSSVMLRIAHASAWDLLCRRTRRRSVASDFSSHIEAGNYKSSCHCSEEDDYRKWNIFLQTFPKAFFHRRILV